MSEESYEETVFEFSDRQWWRIEDDPDDPEHEYEVPFTDSPATMWNKINSMKRRGWEVKITPEGSNRIVLFRRTPPVSE